MSQSVSLKRTVGYTKNTSTGAVITETVFSLHGVGRFLLEAVTGHDYPAAGAAFCLLSLLTVTCNLLSDLLYGITDPRVRLERGRR